jgi:hypothetical protein
MSNVLAERFSKGDSDFLTASCPPLLHGLQVVIGAVLFLKPGALAFMLG